MPAVMVVRRAGSGLAVPVVPGSMVARVARVAAVDCSWVMAATVGLVQ